MALKVGDWVLVSEGNTLFCPVEGVGRITEIAPKDERFYNYEVEFGSRIFWLCEEEIVKDECRNKSQD